MVCRLVASVLMQEPACLDSIYLVEKAKWVYRLYAVLTTKPPGFYNNWSNWSQNRLHYSVLWRSSEIL